MTFFYFLMFSLLFVVHNCRNEAIYITKSDFCFINIFFIYNPKLCINQAIKVTKSDFFYLFLFSNVFTLIVVHNCRNGEITLTKKRITLFDKKITTQKKSKLAHLRLLSKSNRLWIPMITFYKRNQNWRTFDYFQKVIVCESQWLLFIKEIKIGAPSITFKK